MTTQAEQLILKLRELLLQGHFQPGERMLEIPLSEKLNVSRTPLRLALATLAQEGLLHYAPQRGFIVRGFTVKEIIDAVDVRSRVEAMACRLVAQRGLASAEIERLEANLARTAELTRHSLGAEHLRVWSGLNGDFHDMFVETSGNETVRKLMRQLNSMPLVAARIVAATPSTISSMHETVVQALDMHLLVFDAVKNRQPERADSLMQEHIYQARERLRAHLEHTIASGEHQLAPLLRIDDAPLVRRRRRKNGSSRPASTSLSKRTRRRNSLRHA